MEERGKIPPSPCFNSPAEGKTCILSGVDSPNSHDCVMSAARLTPTYTGRRHARVHAPHTRLFEDCWTTTLCFPSAQYEVSLVTSGPLCSSWATGPSVCDSQSDRQADRRTDRRVEIPHQPNPLMIHSFLCETSCGLTSCIHRS